MSSNSVSGNPENTKENTSEVLNTLAQKRSAIPVIFALIMIFFFFSFCDFKCNNVTVASLSGINLVTGTHIKSASDNMFSGNSFNSLEGNSYPQNKGQQVESNIWAILALLMAIGGFAAFYKKIKSESMAGVVAGLVGFISLLLLRSAIKSKVEYQSSEMVPIEIDFLFGYWASVAGFLIAGGLSYLRLKQDKLKIPNAEKVSLVPDPVTPLHINIITQDKDSNS